MSFKQLHFPKRSPRRGVPWSWVALSVTVSIQLCTPLSSVALSMSLLFRNSEVGGTFHFHQGQWACFRKLTWTQSGQFAHLKYHLVSLFPREWEWFAWWLLYWKGAEKGQEVSQWPFGPEDTISYYPCFCSSRLFEGCDFQKKALCLETNVSSPIALWKGLKLHHQNSLVWIKFLYSTKIQRPPGGHCLNLASLVPSLVWDSLSSPH